MKKEIISFLLFICFFSLKAQEHGLVVGGSFGKFKEKSTFGRILLLEGYKPHYHIGYQYRQYFKQKYSLDIHALFGSQGSNAVSIYAHNNKKYKIRGHYISLGSNINYELLKNFRIGLGTSPTWYVNIKTPLPNKIKPSFDIPIIGKLIYSFKYFDVQFTYSQGTCNLMKNEYFKSIKSSDIQLSLFIPLFGRKR